MSYFDKYARHYKECRAVYAEKEKGQKQVPPAYGFGLFVSRPGDNDRRIKLPDDYMDKVNVVAKFVKTKFDQGADTTGDVSVDALARRINNPLLIPGLEDLCKVFVPQLEKKLYGSYLHVERIYAYRNLVTDSAPASSWLWHFDYHPAEVFKVMIYLSDVNEFSGPMEYLSKDGKCLTIRPGNVDWPQSRVPASVIDDYVKKGYEPKPLVGPKGTLFAFDDNIIHRATVAKKSTRDVVVFQMRPVMFKMRPHVSIAWTGSFEHKQINKTPEDIKPVKAVEKE